MDLVECRQRQQRRDHGPIINVDDTERARGLDSDARATAGITTLDNEMSNVTNTTLAMTATSTG